MVLQRRRLSSSFFLLVYGGNEHYKISNPLCSLNTFCTLSLVKKIKIFKVQAKNKSHINHMSYYSLSGVNNPILLGLEIFRHMHNFKQDDIKC